MPGADPSSKKNDPQKKKFITDWGIEGTEFKVTIDVTHEGEKYETWEVIP
jgi:hypothetical protein